jgi:hypothetical protein
MIFDNGEFDDTSYKFYKDIPKPKEGEIVIVPMDNRLLEVPPYINNGKTLPTWFKALPTTPFSLKRCAGVGDYLQTGFIIPMWTNIYFEPSSQRDSRWDVRAERMPAAPEFAVEGFNVQQTGQCPMTRTREIEDSFYPKLVNPYFLITAPGWSSMYLPIGYEPNENYDVLPAIVHTDFYHTANIVLNIKTDKAFKIEVGTPMVHVIPFKRSANTSQIKFLDESNARIVNSRGMSDGHLMPSGSTAVAYRKQLRKVDTSVTDGTEKQPNIFKRWKNARR